MTTTSRPLRKDAARNRELLIRSAREVFAERGLEASLDDVAHHAGLGVGTAYRHFANKHELAKAIFAEDVDKFVVLAEEAAALDDPWTALRRFLEGAAEAQTADRGLREVLMGVLDPEQMDAVNERVSVPLRDMVARAKKSGALRRDVETSDFGVVVLMLCTVADATADVAPGLWRRYLPMLLNGLRPGARLPAAPLSDDDFRTAITTHKRRMFSFGRRGG